MEIPEKNYINIEQEEFDIPIYRLMSIERFLFMLESKKLTLRRPHLWDDPFENILRRAIVRLKNGTDFDFESLMNCFYGQCWTLEEESDAMWRLYTPCRNGIKIKATVRKLLEAVYDSNKSNPDRKFFIGKVCYSTDNDIHSVLQDITSKNFVTDPTFRSQTRTLLIKPNAYKYEKEVRLIYVPESNISENEQFFQIETNELIEEIVFDSRMERSLYDYYSRRIRSLGYSGAVRKSILYESIVYIVNKNGFS